MNGHRWMEFRNIIIYTTIIVFALAIDSVLGQPVDPTPPPAEFLPPLCNLSYAPFLPTNISVLQSTCNFINRTDVCRVTQVDVQPFSLDRSTYKFSIALDQPDQTAGTIRIDVNTNFSMSSVYWPVYRPGEVWSLQEEGPWDNQSPIWISMGTGFDRTHAWTFLSMESGKPTIPGVVPTYVNVFHILFRPFNRTDLACRFTYEASVSCCNEPQPPVFVEQPYWVLLASTCSYFAISYIWVFFMSFMDRFECWRRCCWRLKRTWCCCCCSVVGGPTKSRRRRRSPNVIALEKSSDRMSDMNLSDHNVQESLQLDQPLIDNDQQDSPTPDPAFEPILDERSIHMKDEMEEDQDDEEEEMFDPHGQPILTVSERLANANAGYLLLQFCVVLGNLVYLTILFNYLDDAPDDKGKSAWWRYQQVYLFWNNSSQTPLLASATASHLLLKYQLYATLKLKGELPTMRPTCCARCCCCCCCGCGLRAWQKLKVFWLLVPENVKTRRIAYAVFALNLPSFCTHILPMWLLFLPWLMACLVIFTLILGLVFFVFWLSERTAATALAGLQSAYALGKSTWRRYDRRNGNKNANDEPNDAPPKSEQMEDANHSTDAEPVADGAVDEVAVRDVVVSAETAVESERMSFPWYAVLVLRIWSMVVVVFLMQTPFNLGVYVWNTFIPHYGQLDHNWLTLILVWTDAWTTEMKNRSNDMWVAGMENSLHQYITQIAMFV